VLRRCENPLSWMLEPVRRWRFSTGACWRLAYGDTLDPCKGRSQRGLAALTSQYEIAEFFCGTCWPQAAFAGTRREVDYCIGGRYLCGRLQMVPVFTFRLETTTAYMFTLIESVSRGSGYRRRRVPLRSRAIFIAYAPGGVSSGHAVSPVQLSGEQGSSQGSF
jgi:hypothetical protein